MSIQWLCSLNWKIQENIYCKPILSIYKRQIERCRNCATANWWLYGVRCPKGLLSLAASWWILVRLALVVSSPYGGLLYLDMESRPHSKARQVICIGYMQGHNCVQLQTNFDEMEWEAKLFGKRNSEFRSNIDQHVSLDLFVSILGLCWIQFGSCGTQPKIEKWKHREHQQHGKCWKNLNKFCLTQMFSSYRVKFQRIKCIANGFYLGHHDYYQIDHVKVANLVHGIWLWVVVVASAGLSIATTTLL